MLSKNNKLRKQANSCTRRFSMMYAAQYALPCERIRVCQSIAGYDPENPNNRKNARIVKNSEGQAGFQGLAVCGSVWSCPVCNQRIVKLRQEETLKALQKNRERGGVALHVTTTFSHSRLDNLRETNKNFCKGLSRMKAAREYKKIKEEIGYVGSIRAMEFTHSDRNGWHPHTHEIIFLKKTITEKQALEYQDRLFTLWEKYAVKYGLGKPSKEHGIKVNYSMNEEENEEYLASYVAGWDFEVTHLHTKKSDTKSEYAGRTPWEILESVKATKNKRDVFLFKQFANSVKGMRQLYWSKNLKNEFEISDVSDSDAAMMFEEKQHVYAMSDEDLFLLKISKKHAEVLRVATFAPLFLHEWFRKLRIKFDRELWERREYLNTRVMLKGKGSRSTAVLFGGGVKPVADIISYDDLYNEFAA